MQARAQTETIVVNEDPDALNSGTDIIADAAWFPENFDARRNELLFVSTSRGELAEQTFLDGRWDRSEARHARLDASAIIDKGISESQPVVGIIWHTAFCCSTLLAKALDRPGSNLSLCEPQILVDIANARRTKILSDPQVSAIAQTTLNLLSRPFSPGESVIVKPSPAANSLLRNITSQTAGPMLCLFSDCKSFLISIAKLGEDGRKYVRRLFLTLLADGHVQAQWPPAKLLAISDLELAAIVWHMQMAEFHRNWSKFAERRIASLDCDALLGSPAEVLHRAGQFFSLGIAEPELLERARGPLFRRNAKTGEESWNAVRRRDEHARVAQEMACDLDQIVAESYQICSTTPRDYPLPNPLFPVDKVYCPGGA
jgi:hypothetical protein